MNLIVMQHELERYTTSIYRGTLEMLELSKQKERVACFHVCFVSDKIDFLIASFQSYGPAQTKPS